MSSCWCACARTQTFPRAVPLVALDGTSRLQRARKEQLCLVELLQRHQTLSLQLHARSVIERFLNDAKQHFKPTSASLADVSVTTVVVVVSG